MTAPEQLRRIDMLNARIRRTNSVYARFHGPACLLVLTLSLFPYYAPEAESSTTPANLWQEVLVNGRGVDIAALLALAITAGLLGLAARGQTSIAGLITVLTGSIVLGCTLLHSPGYVHPPALTGFGIVDIVLSFLIAGLALVHALHLFARDLGFQSRGD